MPYHSNLPAIRAKFNRARAAGLIAAAQVLINDIKQRLTGGYTSGAFVTGHVLNSVTRSEPEFGPNGARILVGTNVLYALFWELGHINLFTRRFERVEVWIPALLSTRQAMVQAYQRAFKAVMTSG